MMPARWELAILMVLVADETDTCYIVTTDAGQRIRLWHLLREEFPAQTKFLDYNDFSEFVFCDCPSQGKHFRVPQNATKILVHRREVGWTFVPKPDWNCEIIKEPLHATPL